MKKTQLEMDQQQLTRLSELLLGMAYADGAYDGEEAAAINEVLNALIVGPQIPSELTSHILLFDISSLSIQDACNALDLKDEQQKGAILYLLSQVAEADGVYDTTESDYIKAVGKALGASPETYEDFTIEIIFAPQPPPVPVH